MHKTTLCFCPELYITKRIDTTTPSLTTPLLTTPSLTRPYYLRGLNVFIYVYFCSLGSIITDTPSSVCLELLSAHFFPVLELTRSIQNSEDCDRVLCYAEILHNVMYNMKMYDSSVASASRIKVSVIHCLVL